MRAKRLKPQINYAILFLAFLLIVSCGGGWHSEAERVSESRPMNLAPPGGTMVRKQVLGECGVEGADPGVYVEFATNASPSEVRSFYASELPKLGWQPKPNSSPGFFAGAVDGKIPVDLKVEAYDSSPGTVFLYGTLAQAEPCGD